MTTLRKRFLSLLVSRGLTLGLAMVNAILLARFLGPQDFGLYSYAFGLTTIIFGLADLGLSTYVVRRLRLEPEHQSQLVGAFAVITNTVSLLLSAGVITVAWLNVRDVTTRWALVLVCLPQLFRAAASPARALLTSREESPLLGYQELGTRFGTTVLLVAVIALGQGVLTMIWVSAVPLALCWWHLWYRHWPAGAPPGSVRRELGPMLRDAWPFTCLAILYAAYFQIDVVLLKKLQPLADVGYYGAATRFIYPLLQVPAALTISAFPRLVTVANSGRRTDWQRLNTKLLLTLVVAGVVLAILLAGSAPWLVTMVLGTQYAPAVHTLQIMSVYVPLTFVQALGINLLLASGRIRSLVGIYAAGLIANVTLNLWLIPVYSQNGCAVATVSAEAFVLAVTVVCVHNSWRNSPAATTEESDIELSNLKPD